MTITLTDEEHNVLLDMVSVSFDDDEDIVNAGRVALLEADPKVVTSVISKIISE